MKKDMDEFMRGFRTAMYLETKAFTKFHLIEENRGDMGAMDALTDMHKAIIKKALKKGAVYWFKYGR